MSNQYNMTCVWSYVQCANSLSSMRHNWYFVFELFCHCYIIGYLHTFESNTAKISLNANIHWKMSFRSKPVFNVTAHLYFEPKVISVENIDCLNNTDQTFQMGTLKTCFNMIEATKSNAGRDLSSIWFLKCCSYWALSLLYWFYMFWLFRTPEVWTKYILHY